MKIVVFLTILLASCNNNSISSSEQNGKAKPDSPDIIAAPGWSKEEIKDFLDHCVNESKLILGEDTAYLQCSCVLRQMKQDFPNMEIASKAFEDTLVVDRYVKKCEYKIWGETLESQ